MADKSISWNEEAVRNINGLRNSRMERGITQKELSQLSGIAITQIHEYETGYKLPPIQNYNKLAKLFGWEKISNSKPYSCKKLEDIPPAEPVKIPEATQFKFEKGHSYKISKTVYTEDYRGGNNAKNKLSRLDDDCVFRYEGKQGIHHMFREVRGNWTRTYTDAQLIGKKIQEVEI